MSEKYYGRMTEKWFVVSESELVELVKSYKDVTHCAEFGFPYDDTLPDKAWTACRSRPVEELGIKIRDKGPEVMWIEVKK